MKESLTGHVLSIKTWQKYAQKLFQVGQIRSTLSIKCYMTYMISNVLGTFHQYKSVGGNNWMYIPEATENWLP